MVDRAVDEETERMRARIGPSFGARVHPRIRYVRGTSNLWVVMATRRTRRAAFRAAREMRSKTGVGYRVFRLPKQPGRSTCDYAVAERKQWR